MPANVYIVSGLPRSGTSMMMQMLHRGGLPVLTDAIRSADEDNPRGYFELERVKQTKDDPSWLDEAQGKVVKLISRLLLELPAPAPDRVRYKVIFMRRDLDEVLRSQKKMLERRGEDTTQDDEQIKELFVAHLEEIETWLRGRSDIDVLFVSYGRMVTDPRPGAERINRFLDGVLDIEAMLSEVDPDLYRNRKQGGEA
ncbi:MAG TPA: sulfotransferase domain-containing protein [Haliangium sp.]|nr:sulfotransferase domain-containing protein [Haliangium sp.]